MSFKLSYALVWITLLSLSLLSSTASAQMRPSCIVDPTKPGACFIEIDSGTGFADFLCGNASPTNDSFNEGYFGFFFIAGENDYVRDNPDGTRFLHFSDQEVGIAAYCTWATWLNGLCFPGSEEVFLGTPSVALNGVISQAGQALCPFQVTGLGEMTRQSDEKTITVRPTLHLVPDSSGDCKLQRCEILKRGKDSDDE